MWTAAAYSADACAQTQAQQNRLNDFARFTAAAPFCESLGFTLTPNAGERIGVAVKEETDKWNIDQRILDNLIGESLDRQLKSQETDLNYAGKNVNTLDKLKHVRSIYLRYGKICLGASKDISFSKIIGVPPDYDLEASVIAASDKLLEGGGFASWQTPLITARGDILALAGACRRHIGPVSSDALLRSYGQSDNPRERNYYLHSFDDGLEDSEIKALDAAQCARAIQKYRLKITKLTAK